MGREKIELEHIGYKITGKLHGAEAKFQWWVKTMDEDNARYRAKMLGFKDVVISKIYKDGGNVQD